MRGTGQGKARAQRQDEDTDRVARRIRRREAKAHLYEKGRAEKIGEAKGKRSEERRR